jgi:hypothetical protein
MLKKEEFCFLWDAMLVKFGVRDAEEYKPHYSRQ